MLHNNLLPHQRNGRRYRIHYDRNGDVVLTGKQRSWISHMLRKNLGHKNVAYFILQHGLPELFDAPLRNEKPSQELLQSILAEGVTWHASLLLSLFEHDQRPGLAHARQMSTRESDFRRQKQQASSDAKQALAQGKRLCEDRDSRKRTYSEMSATEQQLLEDFDTNKLQKRVEQTSSRTEKIPFRGSLWNATEQPLQAPPRPAPTPQPPMPEGVSSKSSAAPPQSLDRPIVAIDRLMDARLMEAVRKSGIAHGERASAPVSCRRPRLRSRRTPPTPARSSSG